MIESAWNKQYDSKQKNVKETEDYIEKRKKTFKNYKSFSIAEINKWIEDLDHEDYKNYKNKSITNHFKNSGKTEDQLSLFEQIEKNYATIKDLLNTLYSSKQNLAQQKDEVEKIKNYLVDKKKEVTEFGGLLNAYQLTNKFESFQKMGKQSGFLFYVPAWNTSKMDPVTGFVNLFDTRYESMEKARNFFSKFDAIRFNKGKGYFEFVVKSYNKFSMKADGTRQEWTICTYGDRIKTFRNPKKNSQWDNLEINLTEAFKESFDEYSINYSGDIKEAVVKQNDKAFFEQLLHLFKLTLQMRNSITGTETDYLVSTVLNDKGAFFDSRKAGNDLPQNADANGAYNIVRKGLWVVEQIKQADDLKKLKLAISNKEWLGFVQEMNKRK